MYVQRLFAYCRSVFDKTFIILHLAEFDLDGINYN